MSPPKFIFTVNTKHTFENTQLPPLEELFLKAKTLWCKTVNSVRL